MSGGSSNDYEEIGVIGEGTFGRVGKIRRKSDGLVLCWKVISYGGLNEREKEQLVAEVNILRDLNNDHIVKYYDRIIDRERKRLMIVMEYCSGGDLASLIKKHQKERKYIDEEFIWKVLTEVSIALMDCHKKTNGGSILHRDLKPGNLFLDGEQRVCILI